MKRDKGIAKGLLAMPALILSIVFGSVIFSACVGQKTSEQAKEAEANVDNADFYATQPLHSGLYDASYFDITGPNARKGQFDGRIFFTLSPELSAIYVFENGNRTKIESTIALKKPFEKTDSGFYRSVDTKDNPVIVTPDSTDYTLDYKHGENDYKITFSPKPRYEGSALEILEKINAQKGK